MAARRTYGRRAQSLASAPTDAAAEDGMDLHSAMLASMLDEDSNSGAKFASRSLGASGSSGAEETAGESSVKAGAASAGALRASGRSAMQLDEMKYHLVCAETVRRLNSYGSRGFGH